MYSFHVFFIIKTLTLFILSFAVAIAAAPWLIRILYRYKAWKKKPREDTFGGEKTPIFTALHGIKETSTPRMGGVLIWATVALVTLGLFALARLLPLPVTEKLDFLSRSPTWLPFFTLIAGALIGFANDWLDVQPTGEPQQRCHLRPPAAGLGHVDPTQLVLDRSRHRHLVVTSWPVPAFRR